MSAGPCGGARAAGAAWIVVGIAGGLFGTVGWTRPLGAQIGTGGGEGVGGGGGTGRCFFQVERVGRQGVQVPTASGSFDYFAGGGVRLLCRNTGVSMDSDSVAYFNGGDSTRFIGNVRYVDSTVTMTAKEGTYYKANERWEGRQDVVLRNLSNGSTLSGPNLTYYRKVRNFRDVEELVATGRPDILYVTSDSAGRRQEPYRIVADRVRMRGNDLMWAGGTVTIDRSDFAGRSDSLWLNTGNGNTGGGSLIGGPPQVRGLGEDAYTLTGERIDLTLEDDVLTYVVATGDAKAVNAEWTMVADTIGLDIEDDELEQTLAWGQEIRPRAVSPDYDITADSLALDTPGQVLRELRSFGNAWLASAPDSVTNQRDWIAGDTVAARFVERDSTGTTKAVLERLEARGAARSFRQVYDDAGTCPEPSLNYVRGLIITVYMKPPPEDAVDRVEVHGEVDGVQLEACAAPPPADTTATLSAVAADTAAVADTVELVRPRPQSVR